MKVTFVHAPNRDVAPTQTFGIHLMPVWAYTLAAHLARVPDVEMRLVDDRYDTLAAVEPADIFLFSGINQDYDALIDAERVLRQRHPEACFVIGGPICWSFQAAGRLHTLAVFDHVVVGDGEEALPHLVTALRERRALPPVIEVAARFPLGRALPLHRPLLAQTIGRYYGGVLEVSRGCPFLCEFCDIRVQPDNNRAHVKDAALIVSELDMLYDLGVRQVIFACDNFIGDVRWAERVCDALLAWQARTGRAVSLYTWLTINVARHPTLLQKLRGAGFDMLFIGVESFSRAALLETAKVQNTALALPDALRTIQSYGFVVVAGLIFGFDTDPDDAVERTLDGMLESGLISGDPSLLTALPGTPLYQRLALAGRLRDTKVGLGGFKYQTNVRYLKPAAQVREEFRRFVREFARGPYQYRRLARFYDCVASERYVPPRTAGYADLGRLAAMTLRNGGARRLLVGRVVRLLRSPERLLCVVMGFFLTLWRTSPARPLWFYFRFWLVNWSNAVLKYGALSDRDFDVESVEPDFPVQQVVPEAYEAYRDELVPPRTAVAQRRITVAALRSFVASQAMR